MKVALIGCVTSNKVALQTSVNNIKVEVCKPIIIKANKNIKPRKIIDIDKKKNSISLECSGNSAIWVYNKNINSNNNW